MEFIIQMIKKTNLGNFIILAIMITIFSLKIEAKLDKLIKKF